jgi:hypothetical protein
VVVQEAKNVQVLNNLFASTHQHYWSDWGNYGVDYSTVIWIDNSQNVTLSGNLVTNMGQYGTSVVLATATVTNVTGMRNGIFLADQPSNVVSALSGLLLDGTGAAGASTTQEGRDSSANQQWKLNPVGNGYFTLTCLTNGLNLGVDLAGGSGSPLLLQDASGADGQLWTLMPVGNTNVLLVNKHSGLAATIATAISGETVVQQASGGQLGQQWVLQGAPSDVVVTPGYNQVSLSWKSAAGPTSYNVKRSLSSGGTYTTIASGLTGLNYTDAGLASGTTYYYKISAIITSLGEGPDSIPVSATPSIVGATAAWFRADAISGLTNGAAVTTWNDSSGNGYTASAAGAAPVYGINAMNGQPVVRFTSSSSTYLAFSRPVQDDFTLLFVFQSTQGIGTGTAFFQGAGLVNGEVPGSVNDFGTCLNANGQVIAGTGNPDTSIHSGNGFNDGHPHVVTFKRTRSTGAIVLYVDGTLAASGTGGTQSLTSPAQLVLGAQQVLNNYLSGDLAEVKIFNAALPDADRSAEENGLKCKYGLSGGGVPPMPVGLAGTGGNRQITLSWAPTAGAASYSLYRSVDGVGYLLLTNAVATSVVDFSAVSGQTNYYKVVAVDSCGSSAASTSVGVFLPLPTLGMNLSAGSLTLSWPSWASDWALIGTSNLTPPSVWTELTNAVSTNGGQLTITVPVSSAVQFFRLTPQ